MSLLGNAVKYSNPYSAIASGVQSGVQRASAPARVNTRTPAPVSNPADDRRMRELTRQATREGAADPARRARELMRQETRIGSGGAPMAAGMPNYPGYESGISKATTLQGGPDIHANMQALETLRNESLAPSSESPWLKNALQQLNLDTQAARDRASGAGAGQLAQARSNLAMRGGLSGGASERLGMEGMRQNLLNMQDVNRQAQVGDLGLRQTAEENRLGNLRALPGMEIAATQPEFANRAYQTGVGQYNIGNQLQDISQRNAYNFGKYQEEAKARAAEQMANAIGSGGGGGGTLGEMFSGNFSDVTNGVMNPMNWNPMTAIPNAIGGGKKLPFSLG